MSSTSYSFRILMKLEFPRQFFEKYPNVKFHRNPSGGSRVVPCGQTDGQMNSQCLAILRTRLKTPINVHQVILQKELNQINSYKKLQIRKFYLVRRYNLAQAFLCS